MNEQKLKAIWLKEELAAKIHGWDFSHIAGRYDEERDLPWNYEQIVRENLRDQDWLLDYDTGGGEFLLSLGHPFEKTFTFFRAEADCVRDLAQGDFLRVTRLQVVKNLFQAAVGGRSIVAFIGSRFILTEKAPDDGPEGKQDTIDLERTFRRVIL